MKAIRKALRDERFFQLSKGNGGHIVHGGWTTLTVSVGEIAKVQRLWTSDWSSWREKDRKVVAPSMRLFVVLCKAVDPDAKVFPEWPRIADFVSDQKK